MLCFMETHIASTNLPVIKNYQKVVDPTVQYRNRGGTVIYVSERIAKYVFDISYNECYVSLRLTICPTFKFFSIYITCEGSTYADPSSFGLLTQQLSECASRKQVPILGGDFNSRVGALDEIQVDGMNWRYEKNCDKGTNLYGRTYFKDLCRTNKILPINHMKYKNKVFTGDFTYIKSNRKSQIDYCLTNNIGRKHITNFSVLPYSWHLSDHRPLELCMKVSAIINCKNLFLRALDLNKEAISPKVHRYNKKYNYCSIKEYLTSHSDEINMEVSDKILNGDIDSAVETFKDYVIAAHVQPQSKVNEKKKWDKVSLINADKLFKQYSTLLKNPKSTELELSVAAEKYLKERRKVSMATIQAEIKDWKNKIDDKSSKRLWQKIDWKGKLTYQSPSNHPEIEEFKIYFQDLYKQGDMDKVANLTSQVYIPILDDPITPAEVLNVIKGMKKGGYDFPLIIVKTLTTLFMQLLVTIFNHLFYIKYPHLYTYSLLFAIEKKGDLSKTFNYRGIQMMQAVACVYDRILGMRLLQWLPVSDEQTAYQKGKSTALHILTIRVISQLAKKLNITVYLGFFDIQKAFDHVSRFKMLQKLVKLGIGSCMLNALKKVYMDTNCIVSYQGKYSEEFHTYSGIRQGASSSVLLFNAFMDDLIKHLQDTCPPEPLLKALHALLHADDTVVLSTNRSLFINKCNKMIEHFEGDQLLLNILKSGYMIINGKDEDTKIPIKVGNSNLEYKSKQTYLGVLITDTGNIMADIKTSVEYKRPNLTIKYNNFCQVNSQAPLSVKLKVLDVCVTSSLLYCCETWGNKYVNDLDMLHRRSLRLALDVRPNINNEIIYLESGTYPLRCEIIPRQVKFWNALNNVIALNQDYYLTKLIELARQHKLTYIRHYDQLIETHKDIASCKRTLMKEYSEKWITKINRSFLEDKDSKLSTYKSINPELVSYVQDVPILEYERKLITRYRCGAHNLRIETGRWQRIHRDQRLCICNQGIQTLLHVVTECPLMYQYRLNGINTLEDFFKQNQDIIVGYISNIYKTLKIKI